MAKHWKTPPDLYAKLAAEFGPFDFDPCPCPRPEGYDSLSLPWGMNSYVNPPFRKHDGVNGKGPTAFVHKAIAEHKQGRSSVLVLPVQSYVNHLLLAGAELRALGRVRWLEVETNEPMPDPTPICCFILRGENNSESN